MKVGVYLKSNVRPGLGGNFSYQEKFIRAIDAHDFKSPLQICFVGRFSRKNNMLRRQYIRLTGIPVFTFSNVLNKLYIKRFFRKVFKINIDVCARMDRKILRANDVAIVLFPIQCQRDVNDFPFISVNWDIGQKTTFAFPELLTNFRERELWFRNGIQEAIAILAESEAGKKELSTYYKIPESKIEVVPLFAGGVVDQTVDEASQIEILKKHGLENQNFLYYPAQFWAHKNHYNLLIAFKQVLATVRRDLKLVFSGSDMGNKDYVLSVIKSMQLEANVLVLGFISTQEVYTLYKNSLALVMPTFLGPTNMPLLEALSIGTAVICSDLSGHREQCQDSALYANPSIPEEWTEAILRILDPATRASLVKSGWELQKSSPFMIENSLRVLERSLLKLRSVRMTFE